MRLLLAKDVTSEVLVLCLPENSMCPSHRVIACHRFSLAFGWCKWVWHFCGVKRFDIQDVINSNNDSFCVQYHLLYTVPYTPPTFPHFIVLEPGTEMELTGILPFDLHNMSNI